MLFILFIKYLEIKDGKKPERPITFIFGAKAAPAYYIAKDIIHLLLTLETLIQNDPDVAPYMKLVMVENYNVSAAEKTDPCLRYFRADFPGFQGGKRYWKHEVYAEWCYYSWYYGRSKCGDQ